MKRESTSEPTAASAHPSRRDFLKTAGTAAVAVATTSVAGGALASSPKKSVRYAVAPGRVIGANDRINIGHIGCGGQGNAHVGELMKSRQDLNHMSVAVCDVYENRLESTRKRIEAPENKAYKHYQDLLADKDVDVVWIASPEHWHAKMAIAAIAAGKDVYLEKPMTRTVEEALAVHDAVKASDRILQVGSQGCSDSKWHTAASVIKSGRIGHKVWSQGSYCRNNPNGEWNYPIDDNASPQNLDWDLWLGDAPKIPFSKERYFRWRKYWDYSSGILGDLFPHKLNPFMLAMSDWSYPQRVSCTGGIYLDTDKDQPQREVADTTMMLVDYPSNHTVFVAGSTINEQGVPEEIRGHKATLYFGGNGVEVRPEAPYSDEVEAGTVELIQNDDIKPGESIEQHERNFLRCVRSRKAPNCSVDLATPVMVALAMAELAYKTNQQVQFDSKTRKVTTGKMIADHPDKTSDK